MGPEDPRFRRYNRRVSRRKQDDWYWQIEAGLARLGESIPSSVPSVAPVRGWQPPIDLIEDAEKFILKVELAGVNIENVDVLYVPGRHSILIRGVRPEEDTDEHRRTGIFRLEIFYGEFEREIPLPSVPVEPQGIRSGYRNGFLLVLIPKSRASLRHTRITIRRV